MRVTHVITRLIVGGAQENTIESVLGLSRKQDLRVNLLSGPTTGPEGSLAQRLDEHPGMLTLIPRLVRPVSPLADRQASRDLTSLFRRERPLIVHTHSGKAGFLGRLAAARARVPIIMHTIHGPSFGDFQNLLANWLFLTAERWAGRVTTHFVVVADALKFQYLSAGIGQPDLYTRIYSGFDLAPFLSVTDDPGLRGRLGLDPEDIVVGKIARLFMLKGHDDLLEAAPAMVQACPRLKFLLVGDGPWRARLEAKATALGLKKHVVFTGLVAPNEVPALLGVMDMVVHLSLREGLARALPQALAAGRPVIAYDCDGAKEVCLDDRTGFLLRPRDREGLAKRVIQLAEDSALRKRLGAQGREFVRPAFGVERMVEDLYQLYLRLARKQATRSPEDVPGTK